MRVTVDLSPDRRNETSLPRIVPTGIHALLGYVREGTRYWPLRPPGRGELEG